MKRSNLKWGAVLLRDITFIEYITGAVSGKVENTTDLKLGFERIFQNRKFNLEQTGLQSHSLKRSNFRVLFSFPAVSTKLSIFVVCNYDNI